MAEDDDNDDTDESEEEEETAKSVWTKIFSFAKYEGFKFIMEPEIPLIARIFWIICVSMCFGTAAYYVNGDLKKLYKNPMAVSSQPFKTKLSDVPFPTTAICSATVYRKSQAAILERMVQELDENDDSVWIHNGVPILYSESQREQLDYWIQHTCKAAAALGQLIGVPISNNNNEYIINDNSSDEEYKKKILTFLKAGIQNCSELVKDCFWSGIKIDCESEFKPILTDVGLCCVLNQLELSEIVRDSEKDEDSIPGIWDYEHGGLKSPSYQTDGTLRNEQRILYQNHAGKESGLRLVLANEKDNRHCSSDDAEGVWVAFSEVGQIPIVRDTGLFVSPGKKAVINVRAEVTTSWENIKNLPVSTRNCYFPGEIRLRYYKIYSTMNCMIECIANKTITDCKCRHYYIPRISGSRLCGETDNACVINAKRDVLNSQNVTCKEQCLPSCFEIEYIGSLTLSEYSQKSLPGDFVDLENNDYTILAISQERKGVITLVRRNVYEWSDIIAQVGGTIANLGVSALGMLRILIAPFYGVYLWIMFAYHKLRRRRRIGLRTRRNRIPFQNADNEIEIFAIAGNPNNFPENPRVRQAWIVP